MHPAEPANLSCSTLLSSQSIGPPPAHERRMVGQGVGHQPNTRRESSEHVSEITRSRSVGVHPELHNSWWAARVSIPAPWDPIIGTSSGSRKYATAARRWCVVQASPSKCTEDHSLGYKIGYSFAQQLTTWYPNMVTRCRPCVKQTFDCSPCPRTAPWGHPPHAPICWV
jgi:hypothetical protein